MVVFVDSGYWIALENADDQNHHKARAHWQTFPGAISRLVTTTFVLDEVVTFFNRWGHHAKAVSLGNALLGSKLVEMVQVDEALLAEAWRYFVHHADKRYSLTDCVSFVVMQRRGLRTALTFDRHFKQAGFQVLPES